MQLINIVFFGLIAAVSSLSVSATLTSDFAMCVTEHAFSRANVTDVNSVCGLFTGSLQAVCDDYLYTHAPVSTLNDCAQPVSYTHLTLPTNVP
jgi:hypothetical protein